MVLDGAALTNLEVLLSTDGGEAGSLVKFLDRTASPAGKVSRVHEGGGGCLAKQN